MTLQKKREEMKPAWATLHNVEYVYMELKQKRSLKKIVKRVREFQVARGSHVDFLIYSHLHTCKIAG